MLAVVALGGVAYGLGLLSFLEDDAKAGGAVAAVRATPVVVSAVARHPLRIRSPPWARRGGRCILVTATVADQVVEILFEEGDFVDSGAVLLRLDAVEEQRLWRSPGEFNDQRQQLYWTRVKPMPWPSLCGMTSRAGSEQARVDEALAASRTGKFARPSPGCWGGAPSAEAQVVQ